jgi:hypothetical protein
VRAQLPTRIYQGDPLEAAIAVAPPERVAAAFAFVRHAGDLPFERVTLVPDGHGYFRGALPAALVAPPAVEVWLEVIDRDGAASRVASAERPTRIEVEALPGSGPRSPGPGRSSVSGFFEFVDFNRFRGNDYYLQAESDFAYRVDKWFYAVRTGFGVLYGRGGSVADLDPKDGHACDPRAQMPDPACGHEVGFNYGYVEAELHFGRLFGISARLLGGQTVQGNGVGAELRFRIGNERGTNLQLGGSIISDLGALALLSLEWDVIHGWPMSATVIVSNQPADADLGVRIVYQIAYRVKSWFQPALRIGYDARNVDHGGLSVGLGLVMAW